MKDNAIVWFRNDLRIHDNEALTFAVKNCDKVVAAFIFDERLFHGRTKYGFRKTAIHRAQFTIEAVQNLKENLKTIGLDLYIRIGKPEVELFELAKELRSSWVICNRERTKEEVFVQDELEKNLWTIGQEMVYTRGKMLYYTSDFPFPITQTPEVFTVFRKEVEKFISIRDPFPTIDKVIGSIYTLEFGQVPVLSDLGYKETHNVIDTPFKGGESAGLKQLENYIWKYKHINEYKKNRNGMLGWDYSSKFSAWLSAGCLSPKLIYHEVKKYEAKVEANESTYWIIFELLWRDYFRLMGKKHGNKIFQKNGIVGKELCYITDDNLLNSWIDGETGVPIIDANMKELKETGFISNRGRQLVASFFVKDLNLNWLIGAEYFESMLVDYDPCSNYCNWLYIAGLGNDAREDRYFNIYKQSKQYDAEGKYINYWIKGLKHLNNEEIHLPSVFAENKVEAPYNAPVIDVQKWVN